MPIKYNKTIKFMLLEIEINKQCYLDIAKKIMPNTANNRFLTIIIDQTMHPAT